MIVELNRGQFWSIMVNSGQFTKIALVHDSFTQEGGAERVVDIFHEMFPEAPVFCLVLDKKLKQKYSGWDIRVSKLQKFYNLFPRLQYWLAFIPWAVSTLNFEEFDLVISSSSGFVKNIRVPSNCVHICYCHTPARFLWVDKEYINQETPSFLRPFAKAILNKMKVWDYKGAQRITHFIANSLEAQKRIGKYYHRNSAIVRPPVDSNFWHPGNVARLTGVPDKQDYFLLAGRLQAHKKNDLIIEIFNDLEIPLHVVGIGRQEKYLRSIAKENTKFLGRISDQELREQYRGALGFIYPQVEDFGLMPLEAAACGTATLAYAKGGALETVVEGITGEFFYSYDKAEIKKKILGWSAEKYSQRNLTQQAAKFSKEHFKQQILQLIDLFKRH